MFASRIHLKPLAAMCHRLAIATAAGIKDFKVWQSEAHRGSRAQQRQVEKVVESLTSGNPLPQALATTGNFFPPLFHQMIEVGDATGTLDRTYYRLSEHYDRTLTAKKMFMGKLVWPAFQLAIALLVIGVLIWVMGMLPTSPGSQPIDLLGLGLRGTSGLIKYVNFLILVGIAVLLLAEALRRGAAWVKPIQRMVMLVPGLGQAFQTLALAKFTWAFQLVLGTSMDLRKALPLVLEATGNDYFARLGPEVAMRIESGQDITSALASTGVFPSELLDHVSVGEQSGRLAETMQRLSKEYQERAASAISFISQVAGYLIWLLVVTLIVVLIFRLFSMYIGAIQDATKPI